MTKHKPPKPPVRITERDVARAAGVSASTVSRILNGSARVADDKRAAVEAAIRQLRFRPDHAARSLKTGTTMTVGVLVQDVESPFFARLLHGIESSLQGTGYVPMMVSGHWDPVQEEERVRLLMDRRIDGLVVLAGRLSDARLTEFARHQPTVVLGRKLTARNLHATWFDQVEAGRLATRHLLEAGHQRIAHIAGPEENPDARDRHRGYLQAHKEFGLRADPALTVLGDFLETGGLLAMNRLLDGRRPFTAVFASNDQTAFGARMAMHRRGIRVPEDISIVGVDDLPASSYVTPAQTTVRQPLFELGCYAAAALRRLMGNDVEALPMPSIELVIRDTTRRI